mgnify:CR=1 FL=1
MNRSGRVTVVKWGGSVLTNPRRRREVLPAFQDAIGRGSRLVLVHGGGPAIQEALDARGITSNFEDGLRVTQPEAMDAIEAVLSKLGRRVAHALGAAVSMNGFDARSVTAAIRDERLGRVGRVTHVNAGIFTQLLDAGLTPVVGCVAADQHGGALNVNADEVAGAVAGALAADVVFLSDVAGVYDDPDAADPTVRPHLTRQEVDARLADGRIAGGMIPKVQAALHALRQGAPSARVADGRVAESVAAALTGRGGTRITPN